VLSILLAAVVIYPLTRPAEAPSPAILDGVPNVYQSTDYSCGAASLQAVLSYWGTNIREGVLMERLGTSEDNGTDPNDIVRVAKELGLDATMALNLTVEDLASSIRDGVPVIIVAQAWTEEAGDRFSWADDWLDGHYMVVIGVDDSFVYLEDPALLGSRGMMAVDELNDRWHDYLGASHDDPRAITLEHMGIIIKGGSPAPGPGYVSVL